MIILFLKEIATVLKTGSTVKSSWWSSEDLLLILLVAALLYLPGLGAISLFDRDEPRFAEAAARMLRTGDYLIPHFNGQLRPDKPPLIYWLMCGSYKLFGVNEFGARFPSAFMSAMTLMLVYLAAGARFGRVTGIIAALMLGSSVLFIVEARLATADATMVFFTTLAMLCAWQAWDAGNPTPRKFWLRAHELLDAKDILDQRAESRPTPLILAMLFWVAIAGGILAKGMTLLFVFMALIPLSLCTGEVVEYLPLWWRLPLGERLYHLPILAEKMVLRGRFGWWRQLRPALGIPLLLALVLPWFVAAWIQTDGLLIKQMIGRHVIERAAKPMEGHGLPPGAYALLVWGTFWPWSVLLIPAAYHAIRRVLGKTAMAVDPKPYAFLIFWIVPAWLLYELIATKLVHYVLPLYVPLAILCADALVQSSHRASDVLSASWYKFARWVWMSLWLALAAGVVGLSWKLGQASGVRGLVLLSLPPAAGLMATGLAGAWTWNRPSWPFVTVLGFAASLMAASTLLLPQITSLRISKNVAAEMQSLEDRKGSFLFAALGYQEPSLVFYRHGNITLYSEPEPVLEFFTGKRSQRICLAVNGDTRRWLDAHGAHYTLLNQFSGPQLAKGKTVQVSVITNVDPWAKPKPPG